MVDTRALQDKYLVAFEWGVSTYYGWGVYGLYLMLHAAMQQDFEALSSLPIKPNELLLNPLEMKILKGPLRRSAALAEWRKASNSPTLKLPTTVLHSLGNDLNAAQPGGIIVFGDPTIGIVFSETTAFTRNAQIRAQQYPLIIAGSTWNRDVLVANSIGPVAMVMQGIDPTCFHPSPRLGVFRNRFVIFSGGKLEYRKGQDLVVQAFRVFAERHPDALLVSAWASPWPHLASSLAMKGHVSPLRFAPDGKPDILAWTQDNGIRAEQTIHLGPVPRVSLPRILCESDVAVFPNRAEGGTNLVAMECMACGVPVILSANTGHLDLIRDDHCYVLKHQRHIDEPGCEGWGESAVEEIVTQLEIVHYRREEAMNRGAKAAAWIRNFTWEQQVRELGKLLRPYFTRNKPLSQLE